MRPPPRRPVPARLRTAGLRIGVPVAVVVAVAAVAAVSLAIGGYRPAKVLLSSGTAWLASPQGLVTLMDGPSDQVLGNVRPIGATRTPLTVLQVGSSALVVDQRAGKVARIDGATYAVTGPLSFGRGPLAVLPFGSRAFVVDAARRVATVIDVPSLARGPAVQLGGSPGPGQAVVDRSGTLWVEDSGGSGLVRVDPSGGVTRFPHIGDGASRLVTAQGRPVLVDVTGGRAGWIDPSGGEPSWKCSGLSLGSAPQLSGSGASATIFAAVPATGALVMADLAGGGCRQRAIAKPGTALGAPVEQNGVVLVPDRSDGGTIVADAATGRVLVQQRVVAPSPGLELLVKDGVVFYNDAQGPAAGVVRHQDGQWKAGPRVLKFTGGPAASAPTLAPATGTLGSAPVQGLPPLPGRVTTVSVGGQTAGGGTSTSTATQGTTTTPTTATTTSPTTTTTTTTTPGPAPSCSTSASPTSGVAPLMVTFSASCSGGTAPVSISWSNGASGASTTMTYDAEGSYTLSATGTDADGRASQPASATVTVSAPASTSSAPASTPATQPGSVASTSPRRRPVRRR